MLVSFVEKERDSSTCFLARTALGVRKVRICWSPCLFVTWDYRGKGLGKALMERAVEVAQSSGKKGLVVFKGFGFEKISRNPAETLMWLRLSDDAIVPEQFISRYKYVPVKGKVVVDLFFNSFCQTSDIEAQRVEEVVRE
ncbi:MAG TPA: hypothetical protein DCE14_09575, partial [Kosmotogaceae bacterium]|nr:hypothetical protein [Kosmotogaceae bacterium]